MSEVFNNSQFVTTDIIYICGTKSEDIEHFFVTRVPANYGSFHTN